MFYSFIQGLISHRQFSLGLIKCYMCIAILFIAYAYNFCVRNPDMLFECMCYATGLVSVGVGGYIAFEMIKKRLEK